MCRPNDQFAVRSASTPFIGTCGESASAVRHNFLPAFRNQRDGRVELARLPSGKPASMHLIGALPKDWAVRCDEAGRVVELVEDVIAGFVRDGRFFTREEAASAQNAVHASQSV